MNDAELQRKLSDMTTDMLVDIIINLLNLLKEMELKKIGENQYVCENHEPPIYYPPMSKTEDLQNEVEK